MGMSGFYLLGAGTLLLWLHLCKGTKAQCSKQDYQYCVKLADPLLKDPHLIYPDNARDIEHVCRTWSFFVDCVKKFTDRCFTEAKRIEFNKAVENPVNSIHKLCSMPEYRQDYMKHASCMKMTITQDKHCGRHYRHLVSQVSGEAPRSSICCSHHLFRECVLDQTRSYCEGDASPYSSQMLDKVLSFLMEQCANFIPNRIDCPGAEFYATSRGEFSTMDSSMGHRTTMIRTSQPMSPIPTRTSPQPWRPTESKLQDDSIGQSSQSGKGSTVLAGGTWLPGRGRSTEATHDPPTEVTRVSFGRGMTWTIEPTTPVPTHRPMHPGDMLWLPSSQSTDMMKENAIDEPNQQGLGSDLGEDSAAPRTSVSLLTLSTLAMFIFCR